MHWRDVSTVRPAKAVRSRDLTDVIPVCRWSSYPGSFDWKEHHPFPSCTLDEQDFVGLPPVFGFETIVSLQIHCIHTFFCRFSLPKLPMSPLMSPLQEYLYMGNGYEYAGINNTRFQHFT